MQVVIPERAWPEVAPQRLEREQVALSAA